MLSRKLRLCSIFMSCVLLLGGLTLIFINESLLKYIITTNIMLMVPESTTFKSWKHIPEKVPMDFYFFNWTNPGEVYMLGTKPKFEQLGPYRFMLDLKKENVTWNNNGTVTFKQTKYWYFVPEETNGSLNDIVTTLNIPALGAAHQARSWNYMVRKGISFTLSGLSSTIHVTRTVDELLFSGYPDSLTTMASTMPIFAGQDIPRMDKMGLFYKRNGSAEFEGVSNMGTGDGTVFGKMYQWNYRNETPYHRGECGQVEGSAGINFNVKEDKEIVLLFLPDLCRSLTMEYVGDSDVGGIVGRKYVIGDFVLDNGTKYEENKCFCEGDCAPSGTFNLSSCRYGSPTFMSLPHFYQADPFYLNGVDGMDPNKEKHEFYVVIEPTTGIPLQFNCRIQLNFHLHPVPSISLYEDAPDVYFPIIWFDQQAKIPKTNMNMLKILLNLPAICLSIGSIFIIISILLGIFLVMSRHKKDILQGKDENVPLTNNVIKRQT